ncbi:MAG TPA: hypothetical protein ACFE0H_03595 [Elainellaceae cyanobacterium]|jgi:hypothetical protein
MNKLFRDVVITLLVVPLWAWLHPMIFEVIAAMPVEYNRVYGIVPMWLITTKFFHYTLLFFLTFWTFRFTRFGWSEEVEILHLDGMTVVASFLRWGLLSIFLLLLAPALSVLMLHLLERYTPVPRWLVLTTVWGVLFIFLYLGWLFPQAHINRIRRRNR